MKSHVVKYYLTEGVRSVFLHGFMSFAAVSVIVACLIIMGSFSLVVINVRSLITELEQGSQIDIELELGLSDAAARSLSSKLNVIENVYLAEFVPRDKIFELMREKLTDGDSGVNIMEGLESSLFPNHYSVYLIDISRSQETIAEIQKLPGIAAVTSLDSVMNGLLTVRRVVEIVSIALIATLFVVSLFIMSNTIKLTTFDRREEIGIMRIVGATKAFIRWPFVVEGFLLGCVAGIIAFFIQWFAYNALMDALLAQVGSFSVSFISFGELLVPLFCVFVGMGFVVGVGGSLMTIRKFLKA